MKFPPKKVILLFVDLISDLLGEDMIEAKDKPLLAIVRQDTYKNSTITILNLSTRA
jgi:hypothetical protein